MKLLFQEQIIEFEQTPFSEEVIGKINEWLQDRFYFSHLVADGKEIMEDPEQFLMENGSNINTLEVIAIPAKEFINNLFLSGEEYTEQAIPKITMLANKFYDHPTEEDWSNLGELFEGIQWLLAMIEVVDQSVVRPSNWHTIVAEVTEMHEELENLEEALENTDTVLVADILQYEILPTFEVFATELKRTIDSVGTRENLN